MGRTKQNKSKTQRKKKQMIESWHDHENPPVEYGRYKLNNNFHCIVLAAGSYLALTLQGKTKDGFQFNRFIEPFDDAETFRQALLICFVKQKLFLSAVAETRSITYRVNADRREREDRERSIYQIAAKSRRVIGNASSDVQLVLQRCGPATNMRKQYFDHQTISIGS